MIAFGSAHASPTTDEKATVKRFLCLLFDSLDYFALILEPEQPELTWQKLILVLPPILDHVMESSAKTLW